MSPTTSKKSRIWKEFSGIFVLSGLSGMGLNSIIVNVVPISYMIWPGETYHAFEIGLILAGLFWSNAITGLAFGRLVDRFSRKKIYLMTYLLIAIFTLILAIIPMGQGFSSFWLVFLTITCLGASGGLKGPALHSLSNDVLEPDQRSQFFGVLGTLDMISYLIGPLLSAFLIQMGYWSGFFMTFSVLIFIFVIYSGFSLSEPKRGAQTEESKAVIQAEEVKYDYQINIETLRATMLSKTNLAALIEGLFTCIFYKMTENLILPYIQTSPHNVSPFNTMVILIGFGFPGAILSQLVLSKKSDKLGKKKPINRIKFIILGLLGGFTIVILYFFIPFPHLTPEEGSDISLVFFFPIVWVAGILIFCQRAIQGIYNVNQPPVLQEINLPEAQGQIRAWNQFLEALGNGIGPLMGGILLTVLSFNFQLTAIASIFIAIPGVIMWLIALKYYYKDKEQIRTIIRKRAEQMKNKLSNGEF
jgi:MFS family permease